jgi:hypothetical protein
VSEVQCPYCAQAWERNSEQHACIELFGECICCRFLPDGKGTRSPIPGDIHRIQLKRRSMIAAHEQAEGGE